MVMTQAYDRDVFICHAAEDKDHVVRPLVAAFDEAGVSCWYDEAEIKWGDSVTMKVNEGLRISRYVIVVLSPAFKKKKWPHRELNAILNIEATSGDVKVLPLLVGTEKEKAELLQELPLLNDKCYLTWSVNVRDVVSAFLIRLGREDNLSCPIALDVSLSGSTEKLDDETFLHDSFFKVKDYFKKSLVEFERKSNRVRTDFLEFHNFKFICTIRVNGEIAGRCKIWVGGPGLLDAIAYQAGDFQIDNDTLFNDYLMIEEKNNTLWLRPSQMWLGWEKYCREPLLTPEEASTYLWKEFTYRFVTP
jgi:hypothetical protein